MGMQSISIVGIGRVGGALALALSRAGYTIENLVYRDAATARAISGQIPQAHLSSFKSFPRIHSGVVLLTTADQDIPAAAAELANYVDKGCVVLHASGSLSSDVLSDLVAVGCSTGSMHPLVSISDPVSGSTNFSNAFFCIEGDADALDAARSIVESLGATPFSIATRHKPLYHAAAVTACGHLVALIDIAIEMLSKCGVEADSAKQILFPLVESTIENLKTQSTSRALTGSFARADAAAFERHMVSIDNAMPALVRDVYLLLGERSLELALANGADAAEVQKLRERISMAKRKPE